MNGNGSLDGRSFATRVVNLRDATEYRPRLRIDRRRLLFHDGWWGTATTQQLQQVLLDHAKPFREFVPPIFRCWRSFGGTRQIAQRIETTVGIVLSVEHVGDLLTDGI